VPTGIYPSKKKTDKTGFVTPFGSFRYEKLAFGLEGAPATFSKVMDAVLMGLRDEECLVYLDDILILSAIIPEHARRMRLVFQRIREANFKLGLAKCTFAAPKVSYLCHNLSKYGVSTDQSKVTASWNVPQPKTVRDVGAFLGLSGYYRSFINPLTPNDHYSGRTAPLTSKHCILYIYSTNIGTEYFKHGIYSSFFLFKMQFVS
jgi:hypothetical protein